MLKKVGVKLLFVFIYLLFDFSILTLNIKAVINTIKVINNCFPRVQKNTPAGLEEYLLYDI